MTGTTIPDSPRTNGSKNAFTELMSKKVKVSPSKPKRDQRKQLYFHGRDGLGAYTADPDAFPSSRVIYHNERAVFINDMYPKSSVHTLVLPKSPRNILHPFEAFEDPHLLAETIEEVEKAKVMVASELRRRFGKFSASDRPRLEAMESDDPPDEMPAGRDWKKDVIAGIHAGPSMNHLHVHVMSRDMVNECLKSHGHYQSFTTPFLVRLEEFPLADYDVRRKRDRGGYLQDEMHCWRCGKEFDRWSSLKRHLQDEFEEWKRE
ncbi:hypothetical protein AAFC00_002787 [Neodothiora populina]